MEAIFDCGHLLSHQKIFMICNVPVAIHVKLMTVTDSNKKIKLKEALWRKI